MEENPAHIALVSRGCAAMNCCKSYGSSGERRDLHYHMIQPETSAEAPIFHVIDDDAVMRAALSSLFRSIGLQVQVFSSAPDFLPRSKPATTGSPACAGDDNDGIQALAVGH